MGRRLGQHFLFDPAILDRIVEALAPDAQDYVVEIGAGKGTLTARLAPRVRSVLAIERDRALAKELEEAAIPRCDVLAADALEVDWLSRRDPAHHSDAYKVVGNIPYSITTPLIDKALSGPPPAPAPAAVVFLLQREVGDRLVALPGSKTYGALSVGVQAASHVERLFTVKPGSFRPPPKVDSVVVRMVPKEDPLIDHSERAPFRSFVTALFGQRRKQLGRALRTASGGSRDEVGQWLENLGIDAEVRPEVLTPHDFVTLFRTVQR